MATEERETMSLIGSDKVEGTAVYGADEAKIGTIERVMIEKQSGKVSYAVLSFGGFLGIGDDHYPLPWQSLKYDIALGGYPEMNMQRRQNLTKSDPRDEILLEEMRQLRELAGVMRPGISQALMQRARQGEDAARRRTASTPDRYSR